MALFVDGDISSMDDLTAQDSQLLDVASAEGIDVGRKMGLADDELRIELEALINRMIPSDGFIYSGVAGISVNQVIVTPILKLWHTLRSLELTYADAYQSQLNDRYAGKRDAFHERAKDSYEKLLRAGLAMSWDPIPRAEIPTLAAAPGPLPDGRYFATMSWVNRGGEEGASAIPASIDLTASGLMVVPGAAPAMAAGWNVYVGTSPEKMSRQNGSLNSPGQAWVQLGALVSTGLGPSNGQSPSYTQYVPRLIQRG
jgi:hypothetical protein